MNVAALWHEGGWVLVAIAACSVLGWALVVWKWLDLRAQAAGQAELTQQVLGRAERGCLDEARRLCQQGRGPIPRLLAEALAINEPQRRWFERHLQPMLAAEREALQRHLNTIAVIAAMLPLLGLLGTVLGMQQTFAVLVGGGGVETSQLAGGISKALLTTQAGLVMALPLLLLHGYINARVQRLLDAATLSIKRIETLRCRD